jgi:hypothetical protein
VHQVSDWCTRRKRDLEKVEAVAGLHRSHRTLPWLAYFSCVEQNGAGEANSPRGGVEAHGAAVKELSCRKD